MLGDWHAASVFGLLFGGACRSRHENFNEENQ
jgi:hypothetical protein